MQLTLLYLLPFIISTGISLGVGAYCWRRHAETGAMMYALVAFSQASWTFGYIFELLSSDLRNKIFWDNFQFVGGVGWLMAFVAFTFAIGNLIVAWGLFRYRLFDIVPLAWDKVIENMTDAVVVLDDQRRVVNLNPAARMMAGLENAAVIGLPTSQVFADWPEIVEKYRNVKKLAPKWR